MKQFGKIFSISLLVLLLIIGIHSLLPATAKSTISSQQTNVAQLIQAGKQHYDAGELKAAEMALVEAADIYQAADRQLEQTQILSLLSLVYERQGRSQLAENAIASSLSLLAKIPPSSERDRVYAQVLNRQGRWQLSRGNAEVALSTAQKAESFYPKNSAEQIGSQINQAQAWQALGFFRRAEQVLDSVEQKMHSQKPSLIKVKGLHSLGDLLRRKGDSANADRILQESLMLARKLQLDLQTTEILLSLGHNQRDLGQLALESGNVDRATIYRQHALKYYQQVEAAAILPIAKIKAQLNQLGILIATEQFLSAQNLLTPISSNLEQLIPSRESIYISVNFARNLMQLESDLDIVSILNRAIQQAENLQDLKAESYALGTLGQFYENQTDWQQAQQITQSAMLIAQTLNSPELTYQWEWQLGRLLTKQQAIPKAIAAYTSAINDLQALRGDLVAINPDVQFSFRQEVEPVYKQLVDLLLRSERNAQPSQQNLQQARKVLESLQLAELENFFHSACLEEKVDIDQVVEQASSGTAVIYPIILDDRLEIIVKFPQTQQLSHYTTKVAAAKVETTLTQLRQYLPDVTRASQVKNLSQQLYQWLIQPLESDLQVNKTETLVFVVDGALRNVPMSVFYNPQQQKYLIEQYAIAVAPSLQLVAPQSLNDIKLNTLIAGVASSRFIDGREFAPLVNVEPELKRIASEIPQSEVLFNQQFTPTNLRKQLELNSFSIVHLASHGEFSSNLEQTFILTWNKLLKVRDFRGLLQTSDRQSSQDIELLVLSACETATGDLRAGLGLAGIAVQAGARSTLATFWSVDDLSNTEIMSHFYRELNQNTTKAKALQQAQLSLLAQDKRPYFWSAYVLIGNWL